jgi:hypothetical protein
VYETSYFDLQGKSEERTGRKIWYLNEREDELFGGSSSFDFCESFDA